MLKVPLERRRTDILSKRCPHRRGYKQEANVKKSGEPLRDV